MKKIIIGIFAVFFVLTGLSTDCLADGLSLLPSGTPTPLKVTASKVRAKVNGTQAAAREYQARQQQQQAQSRNTSTSSSRKARRRTNSSANRQQRAASSATGTEQRASSAQPTESQPASQVSQVASSAANQAEQSATLAQSEEATEELASAQTNTQAAAAATNEQNQATSAQLAKESDFPYLSRRSIKWKIRKSECEGTGDNRRCAYLYSYHESGSKHMNAFGVWVFPEGTIWGKAKRELDAVNLKGVDILTEEYQAPYLKNNATYQVEVRALFRNGQPICRGTIRVAGQKSVVAYYYSNDCDPISIFPLNIRHLAFPAPEDFPKAEFSKLTGNDNVNFTNL